MRIEVLDRAEADFWEGFQFYEAREPGLGAYFLASLFSDIESLRIYFGIHLKAYKHYHRLLCKRFPFAVFYTFYERTIFIHAVLDCRREPAWIRGKLK